MARKILLKDGGLNTSSSSIPNGYIALGTDSGDLKTKSGATVSNIGAENISYSIGITGSVERNVMDKLSEVVYSAMDFGAPSNTVDGLKTLSNLNIPVGTRIRVNEGYEYEVAPNTVDTSNSTMLDYDLKTDGDVLLYVIPRNGAIWVNAFFIENVADRINQAIQTSIRLTLGDYNGRIMSKYDWSSGKLCKVMIDSGTYILDKPIRILRFYENTQYPTQSIFEYIPVHFESPAQGYEAGFKSCRLIFTDTQNPGIVIQAARQVTIKNISIIGNANFNPPTLSDLLNRNGWWNQNGSVEIGSQRCRVGINIDPFTNATSIGDRFPAFTGTASSPSHSPILDHQYTRNYYQGDAWLSRGSTQILIENCEVIGWIYGINCAGSPVQLGDSITIEKCNLTFNRVPVVIGESQNRGIHVNDVHCKYFDVFIASGGGYGEGTGSGGFVNGGVLVYGYALVNISTARAAGGSFNDVYAESIWTLGHVEGGISWQFNNSQISLVRNEFYNLDGNGKYIKGRGVGYALTGGGNVVFDGGYYSYYSEKQFQWAMRASSAITGGACFDGPPVSINDWNWIDGTINYGFGSGRISNRFGGHNYFSVFDDGLNNSLFRGRYSLPNMPWQETGMIGYWECMTGPEFIFVGSATVQKSDVFVDGKTYSGALTTLLGISIPSYGTFSSNIFEGDTLFGATAEMISVNHYPGADKVWTEFYSVGHIDSTLDIDKSSNSCKLTGATIDLVDGKTYLLYIYRFPTIRPPRRAGMTAGTNILTSATQSSGLNTAITLRDWGVGQTIKGDGIPPGTRISAVEENKITLNRDVTKTQVTDIYDGLFIPTNMHKRIDNADYGGWFISGPKSGLWPTGAYVRNISPTKDENNMVLSGWTCTTGGQGTYSKWETLYTPSTSN